MTIDQLHRAARVIVKRNANSNLLAAAVEWNDRLRHLKLIQIFCDVPTDEDLELQELSMAELLAEFSDVVTAECEVQETTVLTVKQRGMGGVVYEKA